MAWSRFIDSDLYTFPTTLAGVEMLECCACSLMPRGEGSAFPDSFRTTAVQPFTEHIAHHREAGHDVPDGLEQEVAEEAHEYLTSHGEQPAPAARSDGGGA